MKLKMQKCSSCSIYTIQKQCPQCKGDLNVIFPPKFSIEDKYGKYRRILKKENMNVGG